MKRVIALGTVVLACTGLSWALIDPSFTPAHLVEQSEVIFAGSLTAPAGGLDWSSFLGGGEYDSAFGRHRRRAEPAVARALMLPGRHG
jgi:hypothetical protein